MISRRNVRIKVMQVLYTMNRDETITSRLSMKQYDQSVATSYKIYLLNVLQFYKVAEYVLDDAKIRASKHLPTEEDKNFSTKIYHNPVVQTIIDSESFSGIVRKDKLDKMLDSDFTRKIYKEFVKTDTFKQYQTRTSNLADHREVLLEMYKFLVKHELFEERLEDYFSSWQDDKSLVVGAMKKTIKRVNGEDDFHTQHLPESETVKEYGEELLHKVMAKDQELFDIIEPTLQNWEAERVATIDMILLKMALCELMYFETIPTKVTINEYVDISKIYSTPKSKEFINGILDKLMKQLKEEGKIKKVGRGLVD